MKASTPPRAAPAPTPPIPLGQRIAEDRLHLGTCCGQRPADHDGEDHARRADRPNDQIVGLIQSCGIDQAARQQVNAQHAHHRAPFHAHRAASNGGHDTDSERGKNQGKEQGCARRAGGFLCGLSICGRLTHLAETVSGTDPNGPRLSPARRTTVQRFIDTLRHHLALQSTFAIVCASFVTSDDSER
jgi:hypothetical protein